jgi:diguanylate cyclase (GGDEF)-like protein
VSVTALAYVAIAVLLSALRSATWRYFPYLSASDSINGVLQASHFRQVVTLELAGARRDAPPLACAYLEFTGLRLVSERDGPAMAIAILGVLGRCMRRCLRRADIVGRLGAERFLVLLPETAAVEAVVVLERLRSEFAAATRPCAGGVGLRIVLVSYEVSPVTFDALVRDIKTIVSGS